MVFSWYGTGADDHDETGVPPDWTPAEWEVWKAAMKEPPPHPDRASADRADPRFPAGPPVTHTLPTVRTASRAVTALLEEADRCPPRLSGPIDAGCLGHIVGGLPALTPPHCPLQPYLITLDVTGMPQGLWSCAGRGTAGLIPVSAPPDLLLRIARRMSPAGSAPAYAAPALVVWQVFWPECVEPDRVGGLGETLRSLGALQLATRLLAGECGLDSAMTRALPDPYDLHELGWPADRIGIVGGCALGVAAGV